MHVFLYFICKRETHENFFHRYKQGMYAVNQKISILHEYHKNLVHQHLGGLKIIIVYMYLKKKLVFMWTVSLIISFKLEHMPIRKKIAKIYENILAYQGHRKLFCGKGEGLSKNV